MMKILNFIYDFIWPNRCPFCDEIIKWDKMYCDECYSELFKVGNRQCEFCGMPDCICKYHNGKRIFPHYQKCYSAVFYKDGARRMILSMKYKGMKSYAKLAAQIISSFCDIDIADNAVFIGVPMKKSDINKRGYNQSELIAKELSKLYGCDFCKNALKKVKKTKHQKTLTAKQRAVNLYNAFEIAKLDKLEGKTVYICDDVITTGATINECARILKKSKIKDIVAVSFALVGFY